MTDDYLIIHERSTYVTFIQILCLCYIDRLSNNFDQVLIAFGILLANSINRKQNVPSKCCQCTMIFQMIVFSYTSYTSMIHSNIYTDTYIMRIRFLV